MKENTYKKVIAFEDLEVFQRAYKLSLAIHKASLSFPKIEQYGLADQLRKSSKSICANIAEGYGKQKQSKAEFKRFLNISLGSRDEMRVWIRYCFDLGYIDENSWNSWREECGVIARMLQSLIQKII
jgi:four helix bundle protein